jgi:hypothetical protein
MLKQLVSGAAFLLLSYSAYSLPEVDKPLLAKQCHELSQKIEKLSINQTNNCSSVIEEAATLVESSGQFILKEYWFSARTNLHRSYRLLRDANQMQCKKTTEISAAQIGIDNILEQIYGYE